MDLNTFKQETKAKEREEILQNRKAMKKSKKEAKVKAVTDSLEHDTIAEKNENVIVDVVTNNMFETLVDINDNNENQDQHHPLPRLECESSHQKYTMSGASCFTSTPSTSSAVTSSSSTFIQERIQCDQCLRKCVDKRDMEHHTYLWHTDTETQIMMSRKILKLVT